MQKEKYPYLADCPWKLYRARAMVREKFEDEDADAGDLGETSVGKSS